MLAVTGGDGTGLGTSLQCQTVAVGDRSAAQDWLRIFAILFPSCEASGPRLVKVCGSLSISVSCSSVARCRTAKYVRFPPESDCTDVQAYEHLETALRIESLSQRPVMELLQSNQASIPPTEQAKSAVAQSSSEMQGLGFLDERKPQVLGAQMEDGGLVHWRRGSFEEVLSS